jgi:hypothetical protein
VETSSESTRSAEPAGGATGRWDWALVVLLLVSLALRIILANEGGQLFWPDEGRYNAAVDATGTLLAGDLRNYIGLTFSHGDHVGYRVVMTAVAWAQLKWHWRNPVVAVLGTGLFSVANVAWVYGLARRLGAGVGEARWSALFMAASNSLFYWSRHLAPYDMALCLALACLFVGLDPRARWYHSLLAGLLGFAAFVTYNGYWSIVALALVVHVLRAWPPWREWRAFLVRGALGLAGLAAPFLWLVNWAQAKGLYLWDSYLSFAGTINQGDYEDGHRLILAYLWSSETGLLILWLMSMGWLVLGRARRRQPDGEGRAWLYLGGIVALVLSFIVLSDVLQKFVVYGRLVRQVIPWCSLLAGWAAATACAAWPDRKWPGPALLAAVVAIAWFNFYRPLHLVFVAEFDARATAAEQAYLARPGHQGTPAGRFVLLNDVFIWPQPPRYHLPPHEVLLRIAHPMQYPPFLYEGYNRGQRAEIQSTDIAMQLVVLQD